jgi:hypothetical protein
MIAMNERGTSGPVRRAYDKASGGKRNYDRKCEVR